MSTKSPPPPDDLDSIIAFDEVRLSKEELEKMFPPLTPEELEAILSVMDVKEPDETFGLIGSLAFNL